MKKLLLIAAMAVFGITGANAQEGLKVGAHIGFPSGENKEQISFSYNLEAAYHFLATDDLGIGPLVGYNILLVKSSAETLSFYPLAASTRYSFSEEWYAGADLGYALAGDSDSNYDGGFYYLARFGYKFIKNFDLHLFYKGINSSRTFMDNSGVDSVTIEEKLGVSVIGIGITYF